MTIRFTKRVVFKDMHGKVLRTYEVGDLVEATHRDDGRGVFLIGMGGIWFDEAEEVVGPQTT